MQRTINTLATLNGPLDQSPSSSDSSPGSMSFARCRSARAVLLSPLSIPSSAMDTMQNETDSKHGVSIERLPREDIQAPVMRVTKNTDETREPEPEDWLNKKEVSQRKDSKSKYGKLTRIDSGQESLLSVHAEAEDMREPDADDVVEEMPRRSKGLQWKLFKSKQHGSEVGHSSVISSRSASVVSAPVAWKVIQNFSESDLEDNVSVLNFDDERTKEKKHGRPLQRHSRMDTSSVLEPRALRNSYDLQYEFERQRGVIIELWDACYVPLVHRTHFFLLYKGDPSDFLYLEVELRRMTILKDTFSNGSTIKDHHALTPASSSKAQKWGIRLNTKQRSLQLTNNLWTSTMDMRHIRESAALVAKLVGFTESLEAPKEILGLSFLSRPMTKKSSFWKDSMSTL